MKFSSSDYPSHNKDNNTNAVNTNDSFKAKVKIPNYKTPVQNTSKSSYVSNSSRMKPESKPPSYTPNNSDYYDNLNDDFQSYHNNDMNNYGNPMNKRPMGVPMMPLYGYDNYDDAEKDWAYFRQLHPSTAKTILECVDNECDKLEYDGSCMFDEYPDRVYLGKIVDKICDTLKDEIEGPVLYSESLDKPSNYDEDYDEANDCNSKRASSNKANIVEINQYYRSGNRRRPVRSNNWFKDFIEILLYQEIINRRRRYRSRRRWF